jgi:hypothetical protein
MRDSILAEAGNRVVFNTLSRSNILSLLWKILFFVTSIKKFKTSETELLRVSQRF